MKMPNAVEVEVTPEMVLAALREAENWSSFDQGPPSEGGMKAVLEAALRAQAQCSKLCSSRSNH